MDDVPGPATSPAASAEAAASPLAPGVERVLEVPAQGDQGGEWDLLLAKLRAWWSSGDPQALWQRLVKPLGGGLTLVLVLLVLQVYGAVVGTLESIPLLPGLLELVGLIWLLRHGLPRLLRRQDRDALMSDLSSRWKTFRGLS